MHLFSGTESKIDSDLWFGKNQSELSESGKAGCGYWRVWEVNLCFSKNWKCDALQVKVTYAGKHNFAVEQKIAGNLKKVKF